MKKVLYLATLLLCAVLTTSCEKEEIGGTATESLAGDWYVTADAVDASGNVIEGGEDIFGVGRFHLLTYNTAANVGNQLYIDDQGNFWEFKVIANSDANAQTFATSGAVPNESYECNVTIEGGKIIKDGGVQNNGSKADYIEFFVSFDDDDYPAKYGYAKYKISGVRYSGLVEND